jgi:hypothetical protein
MSSVSLRSIVTRHRRVVRLAAPLLVALLLVHAGSGQGPKFYPDDPLSREPETQDASKVQPWEIVLTPDLTSNLFGQPGDQLTGTRAQNVNTADEVPDSSWFTNRVYARELTLDEITRGPNTTNGPAPGKWTVIRAKTAGAAPGFTIRDATGETWFLSFDGRDNPVAPTAANLVATKLFWALGYNQVETHLATLRVEDLEIDPEASVNEHGRRRPLTQRHIDTVLRRAARNADGTYRTAAGRAIPGRILGGFRYHGTRPDDPNDIVPHEHRRELRALQVFGAWANLVDMKAGNTLDTLVTENGKGIVRHYLQDVGSAFGTGALYPRDGDEGYEYLVDLAPMWKRLFSLGFFVRPWQTIKYEQHPEIGRFDADNFDPLAWRPRVPVAALRHAREDDTFWAALRVMAFTDEQIRAAVKTGGFTDPKAEELLASLLIQRRDIIGRTYYARINPLTRFALSNDGTLSFENPAVRADLAKAPTEGYEAEWSTFDNATGESQPIGPTGTTHGDGTSIAAPRALPGTAGAYVKVSIRATELVHAPWTVPVDVYFRRQPAGWQLVGVERIREEPASTPK